MAKRFTSFLIMTLILLSAHAVACADVTYPSPGQVEAGSELDHLAASLDPGKTASAVEGSLPPGMRLECVESKEGLRVYIRGVSLTAGHYNCIINIGSNGSFICPVDIIPAIPQLDISEDIACTQGSEALIELDCTAADGGELSFQWYQNTEESTEGAIPLAERTQSSLRADTSAPGSLWYFCKVINHNNGLESSAVSPLCRVSVDEVQVESVELASMPEKTEYEVGDMLEPEGLSIRVNYSDSGSEVIFEGFELSPPGLTKAGTEAVTVSYGGKSCVFFVNVTEKEELIQGIGILTLPLKTHYTVGDELQSAGLAVRVYTSRGQRDIITGLICSPTLLTEAGTQTITVSYGGKSCTFSVTVTEEKIPAELSVLTMPEKLCYTVGEELDTRGLTLLLVGSDGSEHTVREGFTCSPGKFDYAGKLPVKVSFGELTCSFEVEVREYISSPEPEASQSPEPPKEAREEKKPGHALPITAGVILGLSALSVIIYAVGRNSGGEFPAKLKKLFKKRDKNK